MKNFSIDLPLLVTITSTRVIRIIIRRIDSMALKLEKKKKKEKFSRTNFHRKLFVLDRSVNYGYSKSASLSLYDELLTSAGFRRAENLRSRMIRSSSNQFQLNV